MSYKNYSTLSFRSSSSYMDKTNTYILSLCLNPSYDSWVIHGTYGICVSYVTTYSVCEETDMYHMIDHLFVFRCCFGKLSLRLRSLSLFCSFVLIPLERVVLLPLLVFQGTSIPFLLFPRFYSTKNLFPFSSS